MNDFDIENLKKSYRIINKQYKKVLIYHLDNSAGFFSEYNCMVFAMLYCLVNKIQFKIYSKDACFAYEKGWSDFFEPFCEEELDNIHHWINMRGLSTWLDVFKTRKRSLVIWRLKKGLENLLGSMWKVLHPNILLTQDVWQQIFELKKDNNIFHFKELGIDGEYAYCCNAIIKMTWNYNRDILDIINQSMKKINLVEPYIGCHIRGGDKIIEADLKGPEMYITKINKTLIPQHYYKLNFLST